MATYSPTYQYNVSPYPTTGSNTATGMVPGQISLPNPAADLSKQIPNLGQLNTSIFGNLLSESQGRIPQSDVNFMQDQAAARAVGSGMPGTNILPGSLEGNSQARNLGLLSYQLQQQAAQQYPGLVGAVSGTQTVSPALQAQIAEQNAVTASAPNPAMAQSYAQKLYNQYLAAARGPGGGTGGAAGPTSGTGTYVSDPFSLAAGGGEGDFGIWGSTPLSGGGGNYVQTTADFNDLFGDLLNPSPAVGSPLAYSGSNPYNLAGVPPETSIDTNTGAASWNPYEGLGY